MNYKEENRLLSLYSLGILDTKPDKRFDRLTRIAVKIFDVPVSLVSLVDRDRQWFKSCYGLNISSTNRTESFCSVVIERNEPMIINDTYEDPRFSNNSLVINEPHIRFYAGYPVKLPDGEIAGTICIIDTKPRTFSDDEYRFLQDLAEIVEDEFKIISEATTDSLTGLCNRRSFNLITDEILRRAKKKKQHFCLIYIDLDNFKEINDNFGHSEGNVALCVFSNILEQQLNTKSIVARLGGDEFGVLLPDSFHDDAVDFIRTLKKEISTHNKSSEKMYKLKFSYGIAEFDENKHIDKSKLITEADEKMYVNKRGKPLSYIE